MEFVLLCFGFALIASLVDFLTDKNISKKTTNVPSELNTENKQEVLLNLISNIESTTLKDYPEGNKLREIMLSVLNDNLAFVRINKAFSSFTLYKLYYESIPVKLEMGKALAWVEFFTNNGTHKIEISIIDKKVSGFNTNSLVRDFFEMESNKKILDLFIKKVISEDWNHHVLKNKNNSIHKTPNLNADIHHKISGLKNSFEELTPNIDKLEIEDVHLLEKLTKKDLVNMLSIYENSPIHLKEKYESEIISTIELIDSKIKEFNNRINETKELELERSLKIIQNRLK